MPFAAIPFIRVLSSKGISICNEETIVARRSIGFLIFSQRSSGNTSKATFDGRIEAIQRELQQFPNPNEVVSPESNEQQQLLRISLRSITPEIVESLPNEMARCAPKCERTVQAVSCRNLNVESATPPNAISSRRIRLRNDIVTGFHSSVIEKFVDAPYTHPAFPVEPIRENIAELPLNFLLSSPISRAQIERDLDLPRDLQKMIDDQRAGMSLRYDEQIREKLQAELDRARDKQMEDSQRAWEKEQDEHHERIWYNQWLKDIDKLSPVEKALNIEIYNLLIKDKDE